MRRGDSIEKHLADTIAAGDGIVDEKIARLMISDAPHRVHDLLEYGVPFDRDLEGHLAMSREAAHSERRVVHVSGDMAGAAIMAALVAAVRARPSIRLVEGYVGETPDDQARRASPASSRARRRRPGAPLPRPRRGARLRRHRPSLCRHHQPAEAAGGGLGMAARAGAVIADPEFVQFHPTALDVGRDPAPLATEALRGEGAKLVNSAGERFMRRRPPARPSWRRATSSPAPSMPRSQAGRGAFLDCRERDRRRIRPSTSRRSTTTAATPASIRSREPIPIAPAEHYHMGGVLTDGQGRATLDGLWACGECTSTGAHGANRLASNSLLEAVVFAARIAADIADHLPQPMRMSVELAPDAAPRRPWPIRPPMARLRRP